MKTLKIALILFCLLTLPFTISANEVGLKVGHLYGNVVHIDSPNTSLGTKGRLTYGAYYDLGLGNRFHLGVYLDSFIIGNDYNSKSIHLTDVGAHLKVILPLNTMEFRPYIGAGNGSMPTSKGTSTHKMSRAGVEFVSGDCDFGGRLLLDFGFISSAEGGINGSKDATIDRILFLRGGISF